MVLLLFDEDYLTESSLKQKTFLSRLAFSRQPVRLIERGIPLLLLPIFRGESGEATLRQLLMQTRMSNPTRSRGLLAGTAGGDSTFGNFATLATREHRAG